MQFGKIEMRVPSSCIYQAIRRCILHRGVARGRGRASRASASGGRFQGAAKWAEKSFMTKNGFRPINFKLFGQVGGKSIRNRDFFFVKIRNFC